MNPRISVFLMVKGEKMRTVNITLLSAGLQSPGRATVTAWNAAHRVPLPVSPFVIDRNPAAPALDPRLPPESCLLLPPTPVRGGQKAVVSRKTNMHIFIESGLQVRKCNLLPTVSMPNLQYCSFPL